MSTQDQRDLEETMRDVPASRLTPAEIEDLFYEVEFHHMMDCIHQDELAAEEYRLTNGN